MPKEDDSIFGLLKKGHTLEYVSVAKKVTRERVRQIAKVMVDFNIITTPPADYKARQS